MITRQRLRPYFLPLRRLRGRLSMALGRAASTKPLSPNFGYSRGTPIDRFYIDRFVADREGDIRGRVLEVGSDDYSRRFGGAQVQHQDVLNLRSGNAKTSILGDLSAPETLPSASFDCIILIQTLHLIFDLEAAVRQLHGALRPGGVLLVTVPGISPIDRGEWGESWCWSFTALSLTQLLGGSFEGPRVEVQSHGNLFAATAFLHGAAVEEVGTRRLQRNDPAYPVTVAARAVR